MLELCRHVEGAAKPCHVYNGASCRGGRSTRQPVRSKIEEGYGCKSTHCFWHPSTSRYPTVQTVGAPETGGRALLLLLLLLLLLRMDSVYILYYLCMLKSATWIHRREKMMERRRGSRRIEKYRGSHSPFHLISFSCWLSRPNVPLPAPLL